MKDKKLWLFVLIASIVALGYLCAYSPVFIKWIVPLFAVLIVLATGVTFLLFLSLFIAQDRKKPLLWALASAAVYAAADVGLTLLVNNVIFGKVAPWGNSLINTLLNIALWATLICLIQKKTGQRFVGIPLACLAALVIALPVNIILTLPNIKATGFIIHDTPKNYKERIAQIEIYENTTDSARPMTDVYTIINDHFTSPLPEGKTEKKVLVLGWDGCRADAMIMEGETVNALMNEGGHAYIAYCGGTNYPQSITQDTSTRPGWTSMLIGQWAGEDVFNEEGNKKADMPLVSLVEKVDSGVIDSSAFYFSWEGHLVSYANDIAYAKEKELRATFEYTDGDEETFEKALTDVMQEDCSDFIFTIFEYCDYNGHTYGFWNDTPEYQEAFRLSNQTGIALINAVKNRPTYEKEDWLILITSDHGGYVRGHGAETLMERMMFIITNK